MKVWQLLIVIMILLASCAQSPETELEKRIARVESGLLGDYGDSPSQGMDISERIRQMWDEGEVPA